MTYAVPFNRLVVQGSLYGAETWTFSMSLIAPDGVDAPTEVPDALVDALTAYIGVGQQIISRPAAMTMIKVNRIGTDGRYTEPETVQREVIPAVPGGASHLVAAQVALAVSLVTSRRRGLAARGRFYLPVPAAFPTDHTDPLISVAAADMVQQKTLTLIQAINGLGMGHVGVVSNVGTGAQNLVRQVRVGRTLDTIRSRRTSIKEAYLTPSDIPGVPADFPGGGLGGGF